MLKSFLPAVLLSALVERYFVSCMRNYFIFLICYIVIQFVCSFLHECYQKHFKRLSGRPSAGLVSYCLFQESSMFAKSCEKRGGFFKCCVSSWSLSVFDYIKSEIVNDRLLRHRLQSYLESKDELNSYCSCHRKDKSPSAFCKKWIEKKKDPCNVCTADAICTRLDSATNKTVHVLKSAYTKALDKVK